MAGGIEVKQTNKETNKKAEENKRTEAKKKGAQKKGDELLVLSVRILLAWNSPNHYYVSLQLK